MRACMHVAAVLWQCAHVATIINQLPRPAQAESVEVTPEQIIYLTILMVVVITSIKTSLKETTEPRYGYSDYVNCLPR
jgi:hypothetical protein